MVDKKVVDWAKEQFSRGASIGDVTRAMVEAGYTESEIDEILAFVFKKKNKMGKN